MNKEIALRTLRAKLYQQIIEKQLSQEQSARKLQVRTCDAEIWRGCCVVDIFLIFLSDSDRASECVYLIRCAYKEESCIFKW